MYLAIVTHPVPDREFPSDMTQVFKATARKYMGVPGLRRKYYMGNGEEAGGVYEFETAEQAKSYFSEDWLFHMKTAYGVEPKIVFYEAPAVVDAELERLIIGDEQVALEA